MTIAGCLRYFGWRKHRHLQRRNPALEMERATFIGVLAHEIPPRLAAMDAMVRFNLGLES